MREMTTGGEFPDSDVPFRTEKIITSGSTKKIRIEFPEML